MGKYDRPSDMWHIVRVAPKNGQGGDLATGWQVRFPAWFPRPQLSPGECYFADSAHGVSEAGLLAARAFRDRVFAAEGVPLRLRYMPSNDKNKSGFIGLSVSRSKPRPGSPWRYVWLAKWVIDGPGTVVRSKAFPIATLGMDVAMREAAACRVRMSGCEAPTAEQWVALVEYGRRKLVELGGAPERPARAGRAAISMPLAHAAGSDQVGPLMRGVP